MKKFVLFFAVLFGVSLFMACGGSSSPGDKAVKINQKLADGDMDYVMDNLYVGKEDMTDEEKEKVKGLLQMGKAEADSQGGIKSIEVVEEKIDEDGKKAKVTLKMVMGNGEEDTDDVTMINDDGCWKMSLGN